MLSEPSVQPLSIENNIYALRDERGNTIGTGTREVCEVLLFIITQPSRRRTPTLLGVRQPVRENVRAAISF